MRSIICLFLHLYDKLALDSKVLFLFIDDQILFSFLSTELVYLVPLQLAMIYLFILLKERVDSEEIIMILMQQVYPCPFNISIKLK